MIKQRERLQLRRWSFIIARGSFAMHSALYQSSKKHTHIKSPNNTNSLCIKYIRCMQPPRHITYICVALHTYIHIVLSCQAFQNQPANILLNQQLLKYSFLYSFHIWPELFLVMLTKSIALHTDVELRWRIWFMHLQLQGAGIVQRWESTSGVQGSESTFAVSGTGALKTAGSDAALHQSSDATVDDATAAPWWGFLLWY